MNYRIYCLEYPDIPQDHPWHPMYEQYNNNKRRREDLPVIELELPVDGPYKHPYMPDRKDDREDNNRGILIIEL